MPRSFVRTPQACDSCRRRKSKCDGVRPCCRRCSNRKITCTWSVPEQPDSPAPISTKPLIPVTTSAVSPKGLKQCLDLFFNRHFACDFCSFDHRPDFEEKAAQNAFLAAAVVALCGRYLSPLDAQDLFQLPNGVEVSKQYLLHARSLGKECSDQPSVTNIQGNLVLAQAELLSNSGSRHWLFAGTAIRMAEIMRLNKDFHQKHNFKEQEIRRRTLWACLLFDRALAYFLTKHRTIDLGTVGIPVPGTDISLCYQEETRGVALGDLATYKRPSDLGLTPYLIQSICLWSDLADFASYSRRYLDKFPPTDPKSMFHVRYDALRIWVDSLHPSLHWNSSNFNTQCSLQMGKPFVSMHLLLRSASCVAHQCYLPQMALYTQVVELVDGAGWSYLHREQSIIEVCVSNALEVGHIISTVASAEQGSTGSSLATIWTAASILIVANTLLWVQYAQDDFFSNEENQQKAKDYLKLFEEVIASWLPEWKAAKQWLIALDVMKALYRAAYLGEIQEKILSPASAESINSDDESANDFRPQPGDGYPSLISLPHLQASIKFATGDTSARSIDIQSIWLQLSGGWPYNFNAPEYLFDASIESQLEYSVAGE